MDREVSCQVGHVARETRGGELAGEELVQVPEEGTGEESEGGKGRRRRREGGRRVREEESEGGKGRRRRRRDERMGEEGGNMLCVVWNADLAVWRNMTVFSPS